MRGQELSKGRDFASCGLRISMVVAGDDNGVQHIINKNLFDLVGRKFPVFHFLSVSLGAALQVHSN